MKTVLLGIIVICVSNLNAQVGLETQIGGANFLGLTINGRYEIPISTENNDAFYTSLGVGLLAPWWEESTMIINAGFGFKGKTLGFGLEAAAFPGISFITPPQERNFIDLIVYPNFNYTFRIGSNLYLRLSGGIYLPFVNEGVWFRTGSQLVYQGDVIPGAGIGFGYYFK